MKNLKQHPLSAAWPAMQADEYQSLKDSITNVGVQNPITLFQGMVLDGWHRLKAALEVGMPCPSKLLGDTDPVDFVKAQNDARRNVTASQRALAISAIYSWKPSGQPKNPAPGAALSKTTAELAEMAGTSERTIRQAKVVETKATPEVKAAVRAGTMSVKSAAETTKPAAAPAKPALTVVARPAPPEEDGAPDAAEFESVRIAEEAATKTMQLLLASDRPLSDLAEKNTQLEAQIGQLNLRIAGLMNSNSEHIRTIKRLQFQIKKQAAA